MPNAPLQQIHVSAYNEADADMLRRFRDLCPRQGVNKRLLELIRWWVANEEAPLDAPPLAKGDGHE